MAYVAVNKDGIEKIFEEKPFRNNEEYWGGETSFTPYEAVFIPNGTIEKLIGRQLTWQDEPVEL